MDFIIAGDVIGIDAMEVINDYDTYDEIPEEEKKERYRLSFLSVGYSMAARTTRRAKQ